MKATKVSPKGVIATMYIAKESAAPMQSVQSAQLTPHVGIEGDRYARDIRKGTYSGRFMAEPGRNLTLVSQDAIQEKMKQVSCSPFSIDKLRRNIVVQGLSASDINGMVGREIQMGTSCRLFVHRRNVPCKYRQADTAYKSFMNDFWEDCGVCCEILQGGTLHVGDTVSIVPGTYQPGRCNVGLKPHGFFTRPADRSLEMVKKGIVSVPIAVALSLWDPKGFEQVESGYRTVGQHFWSPKAYEAGMFAQQYVRVPLVLTMVGGILSIAVSVWS